jgi:TatD DNase family protein
MEFPYTDIHNHGKRRPDQLTSITPEEFTSLYRISSAALPHLIKKLKNDEHSPVHSDTPLASALREMQNQRSRSPVSIGIHPWFIETKHSIEDRLDLIRILAENRAIAAIGECGLDRRKSDYPLTLQISIFEAQLKIAEQYSLPVVIHNVRSLPDVLSLRKKYTKTVWIIHGFIGNSAEIAQCIKHGIYLSPGIALLLMNKIEYHKMYEILNEIPIDRLFLETDGVEVSIETIYRTAAHYLKCSESELAEQIYKNYNSVLFLGD